MCRFSGVQALTRDEVYQRTRDPVFAPVTAGRDPRHVPFTVMVMTLVTQTTALDRETGAVVQSALWGLMVISVLLTLRAIDSGTWLTMWVAALISLTASLIAIWSIGSLIFLLACLQVAAAVALRRSAGLWAWLAFLLAGLGAFGVIIFGLAFVRAWDLWLVVIPLAFAVASLSLVADLPLRRG